MINKVKQKTELQQQQQLFQNILQRSLWRSLKREYNKIGCYLYLFRVGLFYSVSTVNIDFLGCLTSEILSRLLLGGVILVYTLTLIFGSNIYVMVHHRRVSDTEWGRNWIDLRAYIPRQQAFFLSIFSLRKY